MVLKREGKPMLFVGTSKKGNIYSLGYGEYNEHYDLFWKDFGEMWGKKLTCVARHNKHKVDYQKATYRHYDPKQKEVTDSELEVYYFNLDDEESFSFDESTAPIISDKMRAKEIELQTLRNIQEELYHLFNANSISDLRIKVHALQVQLNQKSVSFSPSMANQQTGAKGGN